MLGVNSKEVEPTLIDFFRLVDQYIEHVEKTSELLTQEDWIRALNRYNITSGDELLEKGSTWFTKTFGRSNLGTFLGRILRNINTKELRELALKLGWEVKAELLTQEDWIRALKEHNITSGDELLEK